LRACNVQRIASDPIKVKIFITFEVPGANACLMQRLPRELRPRVDFTIRGNICMADNVGGRYFWVPFNDALYQENEGCNLIARVVYEFTKCREWF